MIIPISLIVTGALTWAGTEINKGVTHRQQADAQKVELMQWLCKEKNDCEPLTLYLETGLKDKPPVFPGPALPKGGRP